eukprot:CAMPEP_0181216240 /NCGR_PEP_ID=MMETSP1096-20121128/26474_1 /TAXON_ID=156174 ORGANISM="Chrysochromulina ericina, Strain CCMP281" /NCGR_SAMPLE_ID=MMETSP1096 /ASSEMBLY_ACC=CAM_ASM_000453 /LENGTH=231 /DNA_ID=CAMNT_0023308215 /DNA_START=193 /DNA_END=888 /DNA_ORIENTATION=+
MVSAHEAGEPLAESMVRQAFVQLLGALVYSHSKGVYHRDVCLRNLCWTDDTETTLQLIDFGHATSAARRSDFAGTAQFAAPEVHMAGEDSTRIPYKCALADVWSAGVCLFTMLAMQLPFAGDDEEAEDRAELQSKICAGEWDVEPDCSAPALDLLTRMLASDPDQRCTLQQVCDHPFVGGSDQVPLHGHDPVPDPVSDPVSAAPPRSKSRPSRTRRADRQEEEELVGRMGY